MIGFISTLSQFGSHVSNGLFDNSSCHLRLGHMSEKGLDILRKQGLLGNRKVEPLSFCGTISLGSSMAFVSGPHE